MILKEIFYKLIFNFYKNNFIILQNPKVDDNSIYYKLDISENLDEFFSQKTSFIEYMDMNNSLNEVPKGILIIPFLCNILPVSWMFDSIIIVEELDKTFYNSINKIKENYAKLYPDASFKGKLIVKNLVDYEISDEGKDKYLSFFSLGVDSMSTVINHIEKKPVLAFIWGSDIPLKEEIGWNQLKKKITEFSKEFGFEKIFIKSDFRELLSTGKLSKKFENQLHDNWWHGIQHGMSIISHSIPYSYLYQINNIFIASSYSLSECKEEGVEEIPCGSSPSVDNEFKFSKNGNVYHDGIENSRQEKIKIITDFFNEYEKKDFLHVCWQTINGKNCNICEKCSRTIIGIISEKADPNLFGFQVNNDTFNNIKENINEFAMNKTTNILWRDIQNVFLKDYEYWINDKRINWFLDLNLELKD